MVSPLLANLALPMVLDQLGAPAFILSSTGDIEELNVAARALLALHPTPTLERLARAISTAPDDPSANALPLGSAGRTTGWLVLLGTPSKENDMDARVARLARRTGLTQQQARVLAALAEGLSNRGIAASLEVSVRTVEVHVSAVFDKLGVSSRSAVLATLLDWQ